MSGRSKFAAAIGIFWTAGCGHTQHEWQQQARELEVARAEVAAQQGTAERSRAAQAELQALKAYLARLGIDPTGQRQGPNDAARAMQEYSARREQVQALANERRRFEQALAPLVERGVQVAVRRERLSLSLPEALLFEPGKDRLKADAASVLRQVSAALTALSPQRAIAVTGHWDGGAAVPPPFVDAWSASAARARSVLVELIKAGTDPKRLNLVAMGSTDPLTTAPSSAMTSGRLEVVVQPLPAEILPLEN